MAYMNSAQIWQYNKMDQPPIKVGSSIPSSDVTTIVTTTWAKSNDDALILIEAAERGLIPFVTRQFTDLELSNSIRSGSLVIYRGSEFRSTWKYWHDGIAWSLSTTKKRYKVYRELSNDVPFSQRYLRHKSRKLKSLPPTSTNSPLSGAQTKLDPTYYRPYVDMFGHTLASASEAAVDGLGKRLFAFFGIALVPIAITVSAFKPPWIVICYKDHSHHSKVASKVAALSVFKSMLNRETLTIALLIMLTSSLLLLPSKTVSSGGKHPQAYDTHSADSYAFPSIADIVATHTPECRFRGHPGTRLLAVDLNKPIHYSIRIMQGITVILCIPEPARNRCLYVDQEKHATTKVIVGFIVDVAEFEKGAVIWEISSTDSDCAETLFLRVPHFLCTLDRVDSSEYYRQYPRGGRNSLHKEMQWQRLDASTWPDQSSVMAQLAEFPSTSSCLEQRASFSPIGFPHMLTNSSSSPTSNSSFNDTGRYVDCNAFCWRIKRTLSMLFLGQHRATRPGIHMSPVSTENVSLPNDLD
ncbi:hypothetical protein K474DRAFT_1679301 [Panus rudis PR-1116 ss-1]|nr:hypothetical protein K474DRAFT_1679301 [Panus rudis PR-1116 ss-1]